MQIGKEEIKLSSIVIDDIIIYVENPKELTKNLLVIWLQDTRLI